MITVKQAEKIIFQAFRSFDAVDTPLEGALGAVLREDIKADRDLPAFHKSVVDGIAIKLFSYQKGNRHFSIRGTQAAGTAPLKLSNFKSCIEIMTGAVLPVGCDCVIPIEQLKVDRKQAVVDNHLDLRPWQYVRPRASDQKEGETLLTKGSVLSPQRVAVAASVGKATLKASTRPKIAVLSTGNELVDINRKKISPYQVRASNSWAIRAALEGCGFKGVGMFLARDNVKLLLRIFERILKNFDVIIISGGSSMGKYDFVPGVLKDLGVRELFHKVSQKPGKPLWFGKNSKGKVVFALPGNPVSTLVCLYRYVLPALKKAGGLPRVNESAILTKVLTLQSRLINFVPVKISQTLRGDWTAKILRISGSGDFAALGPSDGFVELDGRKRVFKKGSRVPLYRWSSRC